MHARWLYGNLIYWDTHQNRIIDAWGPGVRKFSLVGPRIPVASADTLAGWTTTLVEAGAGESTVTAATTVNGGGLLITTDAADNDGVNLQMQGEAFQLAASSLIVIRAVLQISEATQSDLFVGLSITATDILGGVTDSIGFRKVDASTTLTALLEKNSTETTATAHTMVADTDVTLELVCNGLSADFYVNGTPITQPALTNLPDDELLSPAIHFLAGSVNAKTCLVKEFVGFRIAA